MNVEVCTKVNVDCGSPAPTGDPTPPPPEPSVLLYAQNLGDGSSMSFAVDHNLGSTDVLTSVRSLVTGEVGMGDPVVTVNSADQLTVTFSVAPGVDEQRVIVLAVP